MREAQNTAMRRAASVKEKKPEPLEQLKKDDGSLTLDINNVSLGTRVQVRLACVFACHAFLH